jgi:hypothetical protein
MSRYLVPTTNISIGDISTAISGSNVNATMNSIDQLVYPIVSSNISTNNWKSNYLFKFNVSTNNGAWGKIGMTYPWTQANTTSTFSTKWVNSGTYTYVTLTATQTYPRVFVRWDDGAGVAISTSNPLTVLYTDTIANNYSTLRAVFA